MIIYKIIYKFNQLALGCQVPKLLIKLYLDIVCSANRLGFNNRVGYVQGAEVWDTVSLYFDV